MFFIINIQIVPHIQLRGDSSPLTKSHTCVTYIVFVSTSHHINKINIMTSQLSRFADVECVGCTHSDTRALRHHVARIFVGYSIGRVDAKRHRKMHMLVSFVNRTEHACDFSEVIQLVRPMIQFCRYRGQGSPASCLQWLFVSFEKWKQQPVTIEICIICWHQLCLCALFVYYQIDDWTLNYSNVWHYQNNHNRYYQSTIHNIYFEPK